jgi:hypothetical protein
LSELLGARELLAAAAVAGATVCVVLLVALPGMRARWAGT